MAGVAGKDTRRKLPFPPVWERDGQAPELQEHGPGGAGVAAAQELGSLGAWVPGCLAGTSLPAILLGLASARVFSTRYRGYLRLLQSDCLRTAACTLRVWAAAVQFHRINRDQHLGAECNTW